MEILLFSHDVDYASAAVGAGVAKVIVDLEWRGKAKRQIGHDTEVNRGTVGDLIAVGAVVNNKLICRINNTPEGRDSECKLALEHGAAEIWLPMVRGVDEVGECLRRIDGRALLGVLVETREGMELGRELQSLPLSRVYVGLNDYRIDSGSSGLFDPIFDGTLDRFRNTYAGPLGFAGVTLPTGGSPVPQSMLLAAMVRLGCSFGIARRTFRADVPAERIREATEQIAAYVGHLAARSPAQVAADHRSLARIIGALSATVVSRGEADPTCVP